MSKLRKQHSIYTSAVHAGEQVCPVTGAVDTPIYQSTTFSFPNADEGAALFSLEKEGFVYTRYGNPTLKALEKKIAVLENAESVQVTASGMAAISTCVLSLVKQGDHVVSAKSIYSATFDLFSRILPDWGVQVTFVDSSLPEDFSNAIQSNTRFVYIETPSNPVLNILDIQAIAELSRAKGVLTIIDNTFATPFNTQPLELGVDIVVHSATKYFAGHGDAMGGAIAGEREFIRRLSVDYHRNFGGVLSPFNGWLLLRGLRTFALRMERHNSNALRIAEHLQSHRKVEAVFYPGLPGHTGHDVARKQMRGFGGMLSFIVRGGVEAGKQVLDSVGLCTLAVSLGDARTLISHPASTTHRIVPREKRLEIGIFDGLVRLSVGIEDPDEIIEDLDQALAGID